MAGHSKWANIKHKKAAADAKRGKVFTRLIREITVAARTGGSDPDANPRLRLAWDKALAANMTKDTMERAAKRGAGELDGDDVEEIRYEGYGAGGVAIMVDTMSDNRNRTVGEVRHAFSKHGGNLGTSGSVAFQFEERGVIRFEDVSQEEAILDAALEAGAEDVLTDDDGIEVLTTPADYAAVVNALAAAGFETEDSEVTMRPENLSPVTADDAPKVLKLIDALEELDDVQNVYTNADIPEEVLENLV